MPRDYFTIRQQIDISISRWSEYYPAFWRQMVSAWCSDDPQDRAWLMYSANYLLRTGGVRWAIDPFSLPSRVPGIPEVDIAGDLSRISFIVLTHRHADHLDLTLIHAMRHSPVWWIVPQFLVHTLVEEAGVSRARIIVANMREPIQIDGVTITPFPGLHWEFGLPDEEAAPRGVPSAGYLVEYGQKRLLFPGDTRCYDLRQAPVFGPVDYLFAHLWLGRRCALMDQPPLLDSFCQFFLGLQPKRIIITHLNELGRDPEDYWDASHSNLVVETLLKIAPDLPVSSSFFGDSLDLSL